MRVYTFEQIYQLVWKDYSVGDIKNSSGGSSETSKDSPGNDDNQKSHHSSKKKPSSSDEETKTYTVTFQTASGDVFCTQTVEDGKTASKPKLQPSASGSWNYDFTKAVTENIIIKWSAQ